MCKFDENYKRIPARSLMNPKHRKYDKKTPKHSIIRLLKTSGKEEILKTVRLKSHIVY